jgi:hypothetical protein
VFDVQSLGMRCLVGAPFALQTMYYIYFMTHTRFSYSYAVALATRLIVFHSVIWSFYSVYQVLWNRRMHFGFVIAFNIGLLVFVPFEVCA